ncbi:MAG: hypothetical protein M0Z60_14960 [Nitrospiraceae bacterium]|nr:hypothetical protein [Nitrospiraceae bacterium]
MTISHLRELPAKRFLTDSLRRRFTLFLVTAFPIFLLTARPSLLKSRPLGKA